MTNFKVMNFKFYLIAWRNHGPIKSTWVWIACDEWRGRSKGHSSHGGTEDYDTLGEHCWLRSKNSTQSLSSPIFRPLWNLLTSAYLVMIPVSLLEHQQKSYSSPSSTSQNHTDGPPEGHEDDSNKGYSPHITKCWPQQSVFLSKVWGVFGNSCGLWEPMWHQLKEGETVHLTEVANDIHECGTKPNEKWYSFSLCCLLFLASCWGQGLQCQDYM